MYRLPEIVPALTLFWEAIAQKLRARGFDGIPPRLRDEPDPYAVWRSPGLLLSQACGYPLVHSLDGVVRVIATPVYRAEGCRDARYRSWIVVAEANHEHGIEGLRGGRCTVNGYDSLSGCAALKAMVVPLAQAGRFFASVHVSGGHRQSIARVASGKADLASIDCVTYALLKRYRAHELDGVRILTCSDDYPALPYITSAGRAPDQAKTLFQVLAETCADPTLADTLDSLLLGGFRSATVADYLPILDIDRCAARAGYQELDAGLGQQKAGSPRIHGLR